MLNTLTSDERPLVEINNIADAFVTDIGRIERAGAACARLTFVCDSTDHDRAAGRHND